MAKTDDRKIYDIIKGRAECLPLETMKKSL